MLPQAKAIDGAASAANPASRSSRAARLRTLRAGERLRAEFMFWVLRCDLKGEPSGIGHRSAAWFEKWPTRPDRPVRNRTAHLAPTWFMAPLPFQGHRRRDTGVPPVTARASCRPRLVYESTSCMSDAARRPELDADREPTSVWSRSTVGRPRELERRICAKPDNARGKPRTPTFSPYQVWALLRVSPLPGDPPHWG